MKNFASNYTWIVIFFMSFLCQQLKSQIYFKQYIDIEKNCDEFNTQVITKNDSIYLINFVACDSLPYYTTILQFDLKGRQNKLKAIKDVIPNINSGHINGNELFIVGVNNDQNPDSKFVFWDGTVDLDSSSVIKMDLYTPPTDVYLNPIGSLSLDSSKIVYGQYKINNNFRVFSFLLWLDYQLNRDSLILIDTSYDWTVISDAKIDADNNLVIIYDAANIIDHIPHFYRIIEKYNSKREKIFDWISPPFSNSEVLGSFTIVDTSSIVLSFVAEENDYIHSLISIDKNGVLQWEHIFHIDNPKSLYRIKDIITCSNGDILCCGTYENISQKIIETGYLCRFDQKGHLLWERVFYDHEELEMPEPVYHKIIQFNSISESPNHSIILGGRVVHYAFTIESQSDILFAILDSNGCISNNCSNLQDITRVSEFNSSNKTWNEGYDIESNEEAWSARYKFDTIPIQIAGNIYYELLTANSEFSNEWTPEGHLIRYENNQIYEYRNGVDQIIYDFNLVVGDTFHMGNMINTYDLVVQEIDTISLMNGDFKKQFYLQPLNSVNPSLDTPIIWIEDIGNLNGLFANQLPWLVDALESKILCVYWDSSLIYHNPDIDQCWVIPTITTDLNKEDIFVFPNPSREKIYINAHDNSIENIRIYNNKGMQMLQSTSQDVDISDLPSGYYYIRIILKNRQIKNVKFVKV